MPEGHFVELLVEEHLQIGRSDVDGDVFLGLLEVGGGGFQVQLGQGILVGQLEAGEEGNASRKLHVGAVAGRVDVDGGVVAGRLVGHGGLRTSPVPALVGSSAQVGQAGPLGGVHFDGALLGHVGGLADVDVVFDGMVDASAQRPRLLCLKACGEAGQCGYGG